MHIFSTIFLSNSVKRQRAQFSVTLTCCSCGKSISNATRPEDVLRCYSSTTLASTPANESDRITRPFSMRSSVSAAATDRPCVSAAMPTGDKASEETVKVFKDVFCGSNALIDSAATSSNPHFHSRNVHSVELCANAATTAAQPSRPKSASCTSTRVRTWLVARALPRAVAVAPPSAHRLSTKASSRALVATLAHRAAPPASATSLLYSSSRRKVLAGVGSASSAASASPPAGPMPHVSRRSSVNVGDAASACTTAAPPSADRSCPRKLMHASGADCSAGDRRWAEAHVSPVSSSHSSVSFVAAGIDTSALASASTASSSRDVPKRIRLVSVVLMPSKATIAATDLAVSLRCIRLSCVMAGSFIAIRLIALANSQSMSCPNCSTVGTSAGSFAATLARMRTRWPPLCPSPLPWRPRCELLTSSSGPTTSGWTVAIATRLPATSHPCFTPTPMSTSARARSAMARPARSDAVVQL
eukprot:m.1488687 g.1488687  ORF g.1488687 m.1488687 type:complete len:474 (+) comp25188_c0_seq24:443-1864(+)